MQRSLLSAIAQLPEDQQEEAIDSLVDAIIAEGLSEADLERLQVIVDDPDDAISARGLPN